MNPKTRVTNDQIKKLCRLHSIEFFDSERIEVGFSNEVHRVNDNLIVKFYLPEERRYETELVVLQQDTEFPSPKVIAHGQANNIVDRAYIIMSRIDGVPLGHVWHTTLHDQRKKLIQQYVSVQKEIASFSPDLFGFNTSKTWHQILLDDAQNQILSLRNDAIIKDQEAQLSIAIIEANKESLQTKKLYPVFWDIHLDNMLVDEHGKLTGVIDFENVTYASLDYPLFALRRLVTEPAKFATEENEKYAKTEDYRYIWGWYQEYYPEMFLFSDLEQRIKIYQLLDCLRLLKQWSKDKVLVDTFHDLIS